MDTAFTEKVENDESAILCVTKIDNVLYVKNGTAVRKGFPELCKYVKIWVPGNDYDDSSRLYIESMTSGISLEQTLRKETDLNVIPLKVKGGKKERKNNISAICESPGKIMFVEGDYLRSLFVLVQFLPILNH